MMTNMIARVLIGVAMSGVMAAAQAPKTPPAQTVLFVCEHGAAKSVIAAAHFNKIARERGLPYRAVARGTAPDAEIPNGVRQGLQREGLQLTVERPVLVAQADATAADRIVTFEVNLPTTVSSSKTSPTDWKSVPAVSADFTVASADIKRRVEALIDEISKKK
jgi:arsenate reductase (thioredoxin)